MDLKHNYFTLLGVFMRRPFYLEDFFSTFRTYKQGKHGADVWIEMKGFPVLRCYKGKVKAMLVC